MRDGLEFAAEGMSFPIGGKMYVVPPIGMRLGLRLQAAAEGEGDDEIKALKGEAALKLILGTAYDEMLEDDVPQHLVTRAFQSNMAFIQSGSRELAENVWEAGSIPNYSAALVAATMSLTTEPSTAKATKTRTRASSSGTSSRRATSSVKKTPSSQRSPGR